MQRSTDPLVTQTGGHLPPLLESARMRGVIEMSPADTGD